MFWGIIKQLKTGRGVENKEMCKKWQDAILVTRQPTQIGGENRARGMLAV